MDATQKKELLHLRIEQANEQMLDVLAEMAEVLFRNWQPEVVETTEQITDEELADLRTPVMTTAEYEATLTPMTREEFVARAETANEDIAAGRIYSVAEVDKMFGL